MEKDIDVIVWDIETTGFVAPASKILELGMYIVRNGEVEKKHYVFQNNCEIPAEITNLTGITKEIIDAEGTDPKTNLADLLPLFKRCKQNVTHNGLKFDIPFLLAYAADVMGYTAGQTLGIKNLIEETAFDTAVHFKSSKLSMTRNEGESFLDFANRVMNVKAFGIKYNLGLCAQEMKITVDGQAHRALVDVDTTYQIFRSLTAQQELPF